MRRERLRVSKQGNLQQSKTVFIYNEASSSLTLSFIRFLTRLKLLSSISLGSGISQSINFFAGIQGQASPQPIVTTMSKGANCFISSNDFDRCFARSYPISFIAATAFAFIFPEGFEPALYAPAL